MNIYLNIGSEMREDFDVSSTISVKMLKRLISIRLQIPIRSFELYSKSEGLMDDDKFVRDYEDLREGGEVNLKIPGDAGKTGAYYLDLRYGPQLPLNHAIKFLENKLGERPKYIKSV